MRKRRLENRRYIKMRIAAPHSTGLPQPAKLATNGNEWQRMAAILVWDASARSKCIASLGTELTGKRAFSARTTRSPASPSPASGFALLTSAGHSPTEPAWVKRLAQADRGHQTLVCNESGGKLNFIAFPNITVVE